MLKWTPEMDAHLGELLRSGKTVGQVEDILGRSPKDRMRVLGMDTHGVIHPDRAEHARKMNLARTHRRRGVNKGRLSDEIRLERKREKHRGGFWQAAGLEGRRGTHSGPPVVTPDRYPLPHATLTAALCGDPPPGRSALDRMRQAAE